MNIKPPFDVISKRKLTIFCFNNMLIYVGYSASTGVNQIKISGKPYANIRSTQQLYKGHRYIEYN